MMKQASEPSCSIIILTYKKFDNLQNNLNSIACQTFKDYEIIIKDDGSDNFNKDFVEDCVKSSGLINKSRIIHNAVNMGTVRNYNTAIEIARGRIIIPLSQDDVFYDDGIIEKIFNCLNDEKVDICYCRRQIESGDVLPYASTYNILYSADSNYIFARLLYRNFIYGASLYFKKEIWEKAGKFNEDGFILLEDYPFCLKILRMGIKIVPLDLISIKYGSSGISASNSPHNSVSRILTKDNINLYQTTTKSEINKFHSLFVRRSYHYRWLSAYYCNEIDNRVIIRRIYMLLKYPIIAIIHKALYLKNPKEADDSFVRFLYKHESRRLNNASHKIRISTTRR